MRVVTKPLHVIDRWYLSVRKNLLRYMSCETMIRGTWSIVRIAGWPLYKIFIKADVKGQENLPSDPVVIAPRHSNAWDAPLSAMALVSMRPDFHRPFYYMAKRELFNIPGVRSGIWALGAFPVRREENDQHALQRAIDILNTGHSVMIFPEGTRGKKDIRNKQRIRNGKTGAIRAAISAQVPLVPVGIHLSSSNNTEMTLKHVLRVRVGQPIKYEQYYQQELEREELRELTGSLMEQIRYLTFYAP